MRKAAGWGILLKGTTLPNLRQWRLSNPSNTNIFYICYTSVTQEQRLTLDNAGYLTQVRKVDALSEECGEELRGRDSRSSTSTHRNQSPPAGSPKVRVSAKSRRRSTQEQKLMCAARAWTRPSNFEGLPK